jgi:hypothetical protein
MQENTVPARLDESPVKSVPDEGRSVEENSDRLLQCPSYVQGSPEDQPVSRGGSGGAGSPGGMSVNTQTEVKSIPALHAKSTEAILIDFLTVVGLSKDPRRISEAAGVAIAALEVRLGVEDQ